MNPLQRSLLKRLLALFLLIFSILIIRSEPVFALSVNVPDGNATLNASGREMEHYD